MRRKSEGKRFFQKVRKTSSGCWEWQATLIHGPGGGYGVFYAYDPTHSKKKNMLAHRWSFIYHHGSISPGVIIMHTCDNRKCVNPMHLQAGTPKKNAQDMISKKRWGGPVGEKHFNTKLTAREVENIRNRYASGTVYQHQLGKQYGVSQSTIGRIIRGFVWNSAPGPKGPGSPHRGERHHAAKRSTRNVLDIRKQYKAGGTTQRECLCPTKSDLLDFVIQETSQPYFSSPRY